jgi:hypothetical protein
MTTHIDTCAAILAQCMKITAQGKWHVFVHFQGHVDWLSVTVESAETDYSTRGRVKPMNIDVRLAAIDAGEQLAAIRAELDKLEGVE